MKPFHRHRFPIREDVYNRALTLMYGTRGQIDKAVQREAPVDFTPLRIHTHGQWFEYRHDGALNDFILIVRGCSREHEIAVISHECLHMAINTMRRAGIPLCKKSEEAYTYYHMWLFERVNTMVGRWRR